MPIAKIAIAQTHSVMGSLDQNSTKICGLIKEAEAKNCSIILFGELTITGFPPEDLVYKKQFIRDNLKAIQKVASATTSCTAIVGFIDVDKDDPEKIYNAAALCNEGKIQGVYRKQLLPNYSVFDDKRYFTPGDENPIWRIGDIDVGVTICEDIWETNGPCQKMASEGAQLALNLNGSPFHQYKVSERETILKRQAELINTPIIYCNIVGGQDELLFDGNSMITDQFGKVIARAKPFQEDLVIAEVNTDASTTASTQIAVSDAHSETPSQNEAVWEALKLGVKSYVHDNGFSDVCLGLSGGIDSALTLAIAAEALGPDNVHPVLLPSRYSSNHSVSDSLEICDNFSIKPHTVPIEKAHNSFLEMLQPHLGNDAPLGLTEENLQSRIRGTLLMAFSNHFGWLVLTTGNKSELSVGYSTLYGDTAGAYSVIKDVWKTQVYELAEWLNERNSKILIPQNIITKPASAELRPDQTDNQSLPDYPLLDSILIDYVENDLTAQEIAKKGFDPETVTSVVRLVDRAEFKRRQSPLGTRITKKAFGRDRRMPITNLYRP